MDILKKKVSPEDCVVAFGIPTNRDDFLADRESGDKDFAGTVNGGWLQYESVVLRFIRFIEPVLEEWRVKVVHRLTLRDFTALFNDESVKVIVLFTHWKDEPNRTFFSHREYLHFLENYPDFLKCVPNERALLKWVMENSAVLKSLAADKLAQQDENRENPLVKIKGNEIEADYDKIVFNYLYEIGTDTYLEMLKHSTTSEIEFHDGLKDLYSVVTAIPSGDHGFLDLNVCRCDDLSVVLRKCRPECHFKFKRDDPGDKEEFGVKLDIMLFFYYIFFKYLHNHKVSYLRAFEEVFKAFLKISKRTMLSTMT